jgi:alpha-L-fucosidase 2
MLIADAGIILKPAAGVNPNSFFRIDEVAAPLISEKAKLNKPNIPETILFDFQTEAGKIYTLSETR